MAYRVRTQREMENRISILEHMLQEECGMVIYWKMQWEELRREKEEPILINGKEVNDEN